MRNFHIRLHLLYKPTRYIRRRHQTHSFKRHNHSLLSCHSCHTSCDATELSVYYSHYITTAVMALVGTYEADMLVVDGGEADEVHHRVVRNCEGRVLAVISNAEMIEVICDVVLCVGFSIFKPYYTV